MNFGGATFLTVITEATEGAELHTESTEICGGFISHTEFTESQNFCDDGGDNYKSTESCGSAARP